MSPDTKLLEELKQGSIQALNAIYNLYFPSLMRRAYHLTGNKEAAEELCQDVFIYLWESKTQIEIQGSLQSYLFGAIKNKCYSYFKREFKTQIDSIEETTILPNENSTPDQPIHVEELHQIINRAINALPVKTKSVFLMSREEEMTYEEIATQLNISTKTVEYHMGNALRLLKTHVDASGHSILLLAACLAYH